MIVVGETGSGKTTQLTQVCVSSLQVNTLVDLEKKEWLSMMPIVIALCHL